MIRRCRIAALFLLAVPVAGCAVSRSQNTVVDFRERLMRVHTDQILNNLIRAKNRLPVIHLAYNNLHVSNSDKAKLGGQFGQDSTSMGVGTFGAAAAAAFTRTILTQYSLTPEAAIEDTVSYDVDPVMNKELYNCYECVAGKHLSVSASEPAESAVHMGMVQRAFGKWYYIPANEESIREFFKLAILCVTAAAPPPEAASAKTQARATRALERISVEQAFR